jgi:hypothetical protein
MTTSQNPCRRASLISKILNSVLIKSFKIWEASSFVRARDSPTRRRTKKENRMAINILLMIKPPGKYYNLLEDKEKRSN